MRTTLPFLALFTNHRSNLMHQIYIRGRPAVRQSLRSINIYKSSMFALRLQYQYRLNGVFRIKDVNDSLVPNPE